MLDRVTFDFNVTAIALTSRRQERRFVDDGTTESTDTRGGAPRSGGSSTSPTITGPRPNCANSQSTKRKAAQKRLFYSNLTIVN